MADDLPNTDDVKHAAATAANESTPSGVDVGKEAEHKEEHHDSVHRDEFDRLASIVDGHAAKLDSLTATATPDGTPIVDQDPQPKGRPWTHYGSH